MSDAKSPYPTLASQHSATLAASGSDSSATYPWGDDIPVPPAWMVRPARPWWRWWR